MTVLIFLFLIFNMLLCLGIILYDRGIKLEREVYWFILPLLFLYYPYILNTKFLSIEEIHILGSIVIVANCSLFFGIIFMFFLKETINRRTIPQKLSINNRYRCKKYKYIGIFSFFIGVLFYLVLFSLRGIPALSENVNIARVEFITGLGPIMWIANSLIINSISLLYIYYKRISSFLFFAIILALILIFLTGWRGPIIQIALSLLLISSFLHGGINFREILMGLIFLLIVAIIGLYRAYVTGNQIYGFHLESGKDIIIFSIAYIYFRIFEEFLNFKNTIFYFYYHQLLLGKGILMDLSIGLPGGHQGLDFYLRDLLKVNDWIGGGGMPPTLLGSLYADFGIVGVFFLFLTMYIIVSILSLLKKRNIILFLIYINTLAFTLKAFFGSIGQNFILYNFIFNTIFILNFILLNNLLNFLTIKKENKYAKKFSKFLHSWSC